MKKISLLLSIFALAIVSCSKDETPAPAPVLGVLPTRIENISEEDGNSTNYFTYNGNKLVEVSSTRNSVIYKTVYTYNGDLIVKEESFNGSDLKGSDEYIYENNKIKTVLSLYNQIDYQTNLPYVEKTKNEYTYNPDGTVLETRFKLVNGTYVNQNNTNLYSIVGGNLTKRVSNNTYTYTYSNGSGTVTNTSENSSTHTYEYDNKNSPFKNILGFNKIFFDEVLSLNNYTKETTNSTSSNNNVPNPLQPARVQDYSLLYNANDYLTENKYSYDSTVSAPGGGTPTIVIKTNITRYFYD